MMIRPILRYDNFHRQHVMRYHRAIMIFIELANIEDQIFYRSLRDC